MEDWLRKIRIALALWRIDQNEKKLSRRQLEVARLVAGGLSNKEIAARLGITLETEKNHLYACYRKLGVHSREELSKRVSRRN